MEGGWGPSLGAPRKAPWPFRAAGPPSWRRSARFPFFKTIDDFNFTYQSTVRLALLGSALAPDFITEGRCLILYGKPGRGKTHLAVALAYRAIQNGFDAYFTTAAELIDDLSAAFRQGRLAEALTTTYTHPGLLVVDEVGYLTYGTDAANMLFHVVNDRHRRKHAMIFTTNKPTTAWGRVLHDEDLAQAIVDRILERGRLLTLDGPSMRTKHLGLDDATSEASNQEADNLARISGIARPEFPEPARQSVADAPVHEARCRLSHHAAGLMGRVARRYSGCSRDLTARATVASAVCLEARHCALYRLTTMQWRGPAGWSPAADLGVFGGYRRSRACGIHRWRL